MAARIELSPLPPFDPISDPSSLSQRWKSWTKRFETYLVALNVTEDKQKRALLLYQAGQATQEIFETIPDTGDDYPTAMTKLTEYFSPKKNIDFEIFQFRQATQQKGETVAQFATRLRKLAAHCEFPDLNKELKSTIIQNCESKRLRRFALREEGLTLEGLLAKARALEASESQAAGIEKSHSQAQVESVNSIRKGKLPHTRPPLPARTTQCRNCGLAWPHVNNPCPAKGQTCRKCGKQNHFAKVCFSPSQVKGGGKSWQRPSPRPPKSRQRHPPKSHLRQIATEPSQEQNDDSSTDDEYLYTLGNDLQITKTPEVQIQVNGIPVKMIVDTGASTDIIDEATFAKLNQGKKIALESSAKCVFAYGSKSQLSIVGKFEADLTFKKKQMQSTIHVLKGNHGSLLSYKTACYMGLIDLKINQNTQGSSVDNLLQQHPNLLRGIGNLKNTEVKLHIDKTVPPVAQPARRIPFHLRQKVSQELDNLENQGIIEKVEGATPWVSPLVVIPKKIGDVCLCVDMRMANKAINRERHPSPTIDDLIHTLNGATVFSKLELDLRSGYHQSSLAPESRYITTFATHKGLRRYARLNFGTNSASEIFQKSISEQIHNIPGALNISDDVIVFGITQADHDRALKAVFKKFSEVGLTINKHKCEFNKSSLTFFGFVFSAKGVSPDPKKVQAIHNASPPTSTSGVRSFLGMATYCAKFIPNFSDISQPLRELTRKDTPFQWMEEHNQSFSKIKNLLTSDTVMAYIDQNKETELVSDASPWGLSAILSQKSPGQEDKKIVAYASKSLSDVERRYSQTEKEALAIVWAIELTCMVHISRCIRTASPCNSFSTMPNPNLQLG